MTTSPDLYSELTTPEKQAFLRKAQLALIELQTGAKVAKVNYSQGAGQKAVEFTPANEAGLAALIRSLQASLGQNVRRRPIRVRYK